MKKTSKKAKMKVFHIPVCVTISGTETVRAKNFKEAREKAIKQYWDRPQKTRDSYSHGVDMADIDTDFAEYEDECEVEEDEGVA